MAMIIRLGSIGSGRIVCRHMPPPPGVHFGRCGWSSNDWTGVHVAPASRDSKSAEGSTPQNSVSGVSGAPREICQIFLSANFDSGGNFTEYVSGSVDVFPKSSDEHSTVPQRKLCCDHQRRCLPWR